MKKLRLEINGQLHEVIAQKIKGKLWFHFQGRTFEYVPESLNKASSQSAGQSDPSQIVAPMPGKIIKILKSLGDTVQEGETLVVMEAMKMEYNLKAQQPMKIVKINTQESVNVSLGELLVEMEEV